MAAPRSPSSWREAHAATDLEEGNAGRRSPVPQPGNRLALLLLACTRRREVTVASGTALLLALLLLSRLLGPSGCARGSGPMHGLAALEQQVAAGSQPRHAGLTDLVLVAGHAVYTGTDFKAGREAANWYLEPYQRIPGQVESFYEHMQLAVSAAESNPAALLLFSGGATRADGGPLSEGASYWSVANAEHWFGSEGVRERAHTEEYARDSYENLLFSLCRFHELTGSWPANVTVVGYEFKRHRFETLHAPALRWPSSRFGYLGTVAPDPAAAVAAEQGVMDAWAAQPYGCGAQLTAKRVGRDPFSRGVPYLARCAALHPILEWCGPVPFGEELPWDARDGMGRELAMGAQRFQYR